MLDIFLISARGDNIYVFDFKTEEDAGKIMKLGPWSFMGCLMVLRKWEAQKTLEELDFNLSPFWVQIQGLPLGFLNERSGKKIAEILGDVIAVEDPVGQGKLRKYIRVRVLIDISKPLKKGFFLKRTEEDDLWVKFKYERLSDFCYMCGKIGHMVNDCKEKGGNGNRNLEYDGSLRAESSWVDTIQAVDKGPEVMAHPNIREESSRSGIEKEAGGFSGDTCNTTHAKGVYGIEGQLIGTEKGITVAEGDAGADSGAGQVSSPVQGTSENETNLDANLTEEESSCFNNSLADSGRPKLPNVLLCGPSPLVSTKERPKESQVQYFVEEPDSPKRPSLSEDGLIECRPIVGRATKISSPRQTEVGLSQIFNRFLSLKRKSSEDGEAEVPSKRPNLQIERGDIPIGKEKTVGNAIQRGNKNGGGVRGRGRQKGGSIVKVTDRSLVEVQIIQSPDISLDSFDCDIVVEKVFSDDEPNSHGSSSRALVAGPKQPRLQW
ncbi:hypothetical protein Vadar_031225 [Vaccinium darrowii]|uniref:Uncharacterized protein n=1 Tax=Vaccinium darrowii TaxID=229202 RepID=A0ACB7YR41_9ERIC|nr:hypothetical protein Vadar_031225 [Vaccinium darrowii]